MAQLGRISGHLLNANLERNGVDLTFKNTNFDSALLFLDVNSNKIGVKTDSPIFDLDINNDISTTNANATNRANIDNIIVNNNSNFTTKVGPINIVPDQNNPNIFLNRMRSDDLDFNDNTISGLNSNQPVAFQASGSGTIEVFANANVTGDLSISGNVLIDGNLSSAGTVIVGDSPLDTITIAPDLTQNIVPGDDNVHELGQQANDSSPRRWAELWTPDLTNVDTMRPNAAIVSDQTSMDGVNNEIFALQSNDPIVLAPDSGINYIEWTRWHEITASSTSASISGTTLTVGGTITGSFIPGTQLSGVGILPGTVITETSTGSDSSGTYTVNLNYDGSGGNPSPIGPISITGSVDNIDNLTDIGGGPRISPQTPLTFASTGIGYLRFTDTSAIVVPAGDNSDRPARPELGDTRWNTALDYLECFAGPVEAVTASGTVSGLADQTVSSGATTSDGPGTGAAFNLSIVSGVLSISITAVGQEYLQGDKIYISGTVFVGGSSPANDIELTVGAQTTGGYAIATGGGEEVTEELMEDLGNVYALILA
jgi:hypothetical protein